MAANSQIIYKSAIPDVFIPQVSVFESILPADDPYPAGRPALIDGVTGEVWTRNELRARSLTLAWAMVNRLGLRGQPSVIPLYDLTLTAFMKRAQSS